MNKSCTSHEQLLEKLWESWTSTSTKQSGKVVNKNNCVFKVETGDEMLGADAATDLEEPVQEDLHQDPHDQEEGAVETN